MEEIVGLVFALADAYLDLSSANNDNGELLDRLNEIEGYLIAIREQLEAITDKLNEIERLILQLPQVIRGVFDEELIKKSLGEARGACNRLHDYSRPDSLEQDLKYFHDDLSRLQDSILGIRALGGVSGLVITSPLLAIWLTGRATEEKGFQAYVAGHKIESPWDDQFMADSKNAFKEAFEILDDRRIYFETYFLPHEPYNRRAQRVVQIGSDYYFEGVGPQSIEQKYRVIYDDDKPRLQAYWILEDDWIDVDPHKSGTYLRGASAFLKWQDDKAAFRAFQGIGPPLLANQDKILATFVEPKNFWLTTNPKPRFQDNAISS
jgi:hypothetical protein